MKIDFLLKRCSFCNNEDMTISDRLALQGFGHRKAPDCEHNGKREVFFLASGKRVASMDAAEACEFVESAERFGIAA